MRTPAVLAVVAAAALSSCTRDLSLPPPPVVTDGAIAGRVVIAQPGSQTKLPAAGARVELLGTGRVVFADTEGRFVLSGIDFEVAAGADQPPLLIQFDPGSTGTPSRQRLVDLGAFGPKPGLQLSIGDVAVSENARLRGKILRADAPAAGGHAGTVVYVPQGPFTTFTNDDGSFELRDMPEGKISLAAFRTGYESVVVDALELRAGEDFQLRELSVQPLTGGGTGTPGKIKGTVTFDAPPSGAGATSVSAVDGSGASHAAAAAADGTFLIEAVPPGVYQVTAVRLGYQPAIVPNVAVAPGGEATVAGLRLAAEGSGGGGTCVPNLACRPPGADATCKIGVTSCTAGTSCTVVGNAIDGTACGEGAVCRGGLCRPVCDAGRVCTPANRCHVGVVVCSAEGVASCVDIGAELPDGYACDVGQSCSAGACVPCTGAGCGTCSVQCVPANPCHLGARSCTAGASTACTDTNLNRPDGTGCGTNLVCRAGACVPCAEGNSCEAATNRCKLGFVSCSSGFPVCTEGANKPDGTSCGPGDACRAGACVPAGGQVQTLVPGPAGSPGNASLRSPAVATNGDVYYVDYYGHTVKRLAGGTGAPEVVAGTGTAGASVDNQPAVNATLYYPISVALDEGAGLLYVADTYNNRIRAIQLVGNRWILNVAGGGTQPSPAYGDGGPAGQAELSRPESLALGTDGGKKYLYFYDSGHSRFRRVDLTPPGRIEAWDIPSACAQPVAVNGCGGQNSCGITSAGSAGMFVSGSICGTRVGPGTYGIVRIPPGGGAPVHVLGRSPGLLTEGGAARATSVTESPGLATDGAGSLYYTAFSTTTAPNVVRRITPTGVVRTVAGAGAASSTGDGGSALAATFNGPTSLAFSPQAPSPGVDAVVAETRGNVLRRILGLGSSTFQRGSLTGTSGASQTTLIGQAPVTLAGATLLDGSGGAMTGFEVAAAPTSSPPGTLSQPTAITDVNGVAAFGLRVGFTPGTYSFQATYRDIYGEHVPGSPAEFAVTATEPAPGTIMTVVNEERIASSAEFGVPGFGPLARLYYPSNAVAGPDGTVYVAGYYNHRIYALSPEGVIRVVAGTGSAGGAGDGLLAVDAQLYYPFSVALDDAGTRLFIADSYNDRVRVVNLATGFIGTVAGTGVSGSSGDGGPAILAQLARPLTLAQRGGKLYIGENNAAVRVVDLTAATPTISTALPNGTGCAGAVTWNGCQSSYGCGLAVDPAGALYASGYMCGTATGSNYVYGIAKWDGVTLTHVAGKAAAGANNSDGAPAALSSFVSPPPLSFGPGGRLFVADVGSHRVRFIDLSGAAPVNRTWFGSGTAGYAGNYVNTATSPTGVQLNYPVAIAFTPAGHAIVVDHYNHAVRMVWKAAQVLP